MKGQIILWDRCVYYTEYGKLTGCVTIIRREWTSDSQSLVQKGYIINRIMSIFQSKRVCSGLVYQLSGAIPLICQLW